MAKIIKGGFIYLHIPKTGGNWLTSLLDAHGLIVGEIGHKHATYDLVAGLMQRRPSLRLRRWWTPGASAYTFMAVVRHPLRWYESWYKYQHAKRFRDWGRNGEPVAWHVMSSLNGLEAPDFNTFLRAIHRRDPGFVTKLYGRYVTNSGAVVLRNETLRQDLATLNRERSLGIPPGAIDAAPALGVSPRMEIVWDRELFEETVRLEAAALRQFGYAAEGVVRVQ